MARSKAARRYRRNKSEGASSRNLLRSNPPLLTDVALFIAPGFGGYVASRIVTRVGATAAGKFRPSLQKHAGAAISVGTFAATWFLAHRWKPLARFHTPLVVGAGIAALQTVLQCYLPKIGGFLNLPPAPARTTAAVAAPATTGALTSDGNEFFTYNDMFDQGVYAGAAAAPPDVPGSPVEQARAADELDTLADVMQDLGADSLDMGGDAGIFSN